MTRRTVTVGLVCLAMLLTAKTASSFQGSGDLLGGDGIIPINPDFSGGGALITIDPDVLVPDPRAGAAFIRQALLGVGPGSIQIPVDVQTELSAALSQAISATNRPSVLTPFAGQIGTDEQGIPFFDQIGSLATSKATTIGKGNLGFGVSYQHSRFREFKGDSIGDAVSFETTQRIVQMFDPTTNPSSDIPFNLITDQTVTQRVSGVRFSADVITLAITYGLLDRLDIGALVPYIFLESEGKVSLETTTTVNLVAPGVPDLQTGTISESTTISDRWEDHENGFGDIILFAKFQILSQDGRIGNRQTSAMDLALQLEIKTQTGEEDDFLGTGDTDIAGRLVAQAKISDSLLIRGEAGGNYSGLDSGFSTLEYKAGLEWLPLEESALALSAEVIGSHSHDFHAIVDAVVGGKYIFGNDLALFGGIRFPLNDNGLRFDIAPILGIEYTFDRAFGGGAAAIASLPERNLPDFVPMDGERAVAATSTNVELDAPATVEIAAAAGHELPALPKPLHLPLAGTGGGRRN